MKKATSRRVTKTASIMIILVLLIGGTIYLRAVTNADSLDNRNLRELSRIGQGVEGRINNLDKVMKSLSKESIDEVYDRANLIPHLSMTGIDEKPDTNGIHQVADHTIFNIDLPSRSFQLDYGFKTVIMTQQKA